MGVGKLIKLPTITEMGVVTSAKTGVKREIAPEKKTTWELMGVDPPNTPPGILPMGVGAYITTNPPLKTTPYLSHDD
jgi:hypothetical protein